MAFGLYATLAVFVERSDVSPEFEIGFYQSCPWVNGSLELRL